MDVVFGFSGLLIVLSLLFLLPLPISFFKVVNSLKPTYWLFLGAAITAAVPGYEGFNVILRPAPVNAGKAYDFRADTAYMNALVDVLKLGLVLACFWAFAIVQQLSTQLALSKEKLSKAELNRLATQKQAVAASKQTLAMLDELESIKNNQKIVKLSESTNVEDLKSALKQKEIELEETKLKCKIIQDNYVKLIEECSKLEAKVHNPGNKKESKKNK